VAAPDSTVSVVVAVRNGERFLAQALESVFRQSLPPLEVIVVDDGSADRTADIVREFPVLLVSSEGRGAPAARNAGVRQARGDLVALLDHDDIWEPHKLERQVAHLAPGPLAYVVSRLVVFVEPGTARPGWVRDEHLTDGFIGSTPSVILAWRATFEAVGGFDPKLEWGEDADWLLRANELGATRGVVDEILVRYRLHEGNLTHQRDTDQDVLGILRSALARRRAAAAEGQSHGN
jgi:glycosyltransferase involved in cell wall biosynthesis